MIKSETEYDAIMRTCNRLMEKQMNEEKKMVRIGKNLSESEYDKSALYIDFKKLKKGDYIKNWIGIIHKIKSNCIDDDYYLISRCYRNKKGGMSVRREKKIIHCEELIDLDCFKLTVEQAAERLGAELSKTQEV